MAGEQKSATGTQTGRRGPLGNALQSVHSGISPSSYIADMICPSIPVAYRLLGLNIELLREHREAIDIVLYRCGKLLR